MTWIAGVDGCRAGWFVVLRDLKTGETRHRLVDNFAELLDVPEQPKAISIDIPIGLADEAARGGRLCDREARALLGRRGASVFPPPARAALAGASYADALRLNRESSGEGIGLSRQAHGLFLKLKEVDELMTPALQSRVFETHPELVFMEMNGGESPRWGKKSLPGLMARLELLEQAGFGRDIIDVALESYPESRVASDDILDAFAASWTAERILRKTALKVPSGPSPTDSRDLRMEMWRLAPMARRRSPIGRPGCPGGE